MVTEEFHVRPAVFADHRQIANLIHFEPRLHQHLDWRNPLDWIGNPPFLVAESEGKMVAAMGCPPDPPGVAWIRLFVCAGAISAGQAWQNLWEVARLELERSGHFMAAAILLSDWFKELLEASGFKTTQQIVMLVRNIQEIPEGVPPAGITIRPLMYYDLPAVAEADADSFDLLWQNSFPALNRAYPQSAWASVAEAEGRILGYQISTRNPLGGHLARLAVRKNEQGRGVGRALVADLIRRMASQGLSHLTVNTQSDNTVSLSLYRKIGFQETGDRYPVYVFEK